MPSATVTGALLGLAYQIHANSLRKRQANHPFGHVVAMAIGAVIANQIVVWDKNAQQRKQQRRQGYHFVVHRRQGKQANESDQAP